MDGFSTFLAERASNSALQDALISELGTLGYNKIKLPTQSRLYVYVPKSERRPAAEDLLKRLNAAVHDTSVKAGRVSSMGLITFAENSPFHGMEIAIKPDATKDLSIDEQESLQAYFIAAATRIPNTEFTIDEVESVADTVQSKFSVQELMGKASSAWLKSAKTTAQTIASSNYSNQYIICQRSKSKFVDNISSAANDLLKSAGFSIQLDKWNPADIWMVDPSLINHDWKQYDSITELNSVIHDLFDQRKLVGVSLKMVGDSPKIETFNYEQQKKIAEFDSYDMGRSGFIKAMDINIYFSKVGRITIRSFGRPVNVNAEIQGKYAAGGKVGATALFGIIKSVDRRFRPTRARDTAAAFDRDPRKVTDQLYKWGQKLDPSTMRGLDADEYFEKVVAKKNALTYCISKTQACEIAYSIERMSQEQRGDMIQKMVDYASSSTEVSSVFIKVS